MALTPPSSAETLSHAGGAIRVWTGGRARADGDPDNFVCYFFCSPGISREGFYTNPSLADLLMNAQKLTDHAKRAELYRKAEQIIHDEVVRVFIANNQPPIPLQRRVRGYVPNPTAVEYFNTVSFGQ